MELVMFVLVLVFWILYYILQGRHDTAFVKEVRLLQERIATSDLERIEKQVIRWELSWKRWDVLEKLLVKVVIATGVYFLSGDLILALLLFVLSIFIRWLVHDLVVALGLGAGWNHIGPDYIATDRFLRTLQKMGINQYLVKILPVLILTILTCWYLVKA